MPTVEDEVTTRVRERAEQAHQAVADAERRRDAAREGVVSAAGTIRPNRAQEVAARQVEIDALRAFAEARDADLKHAIDDADRRADIRALVVTERGEMDNMDKALAKARAAVAKLEGERERQFAAISQLEHAASRTEAELDAAGVTAVTA